MANIDVNEIKNAVIKLSQDDGSKAAFAQDPVKAVEALLGGIKICKEYPNVYAHIDKHAHLLSCLADVYFEMGEFDKCREVIAEFDELTEKNKDNKIHVINRIKYM